MKKVLLLGIPVLVLVVVLMLIIGRKTEPEPADYTSGTQSDVSTVDTEKGIAEPSVPETAKPAEEPALSDLVGTILSDEASYSERHLAIEKLGKTLSADDVFALRDFLLTSTDEHKMSPIMLNSLKNDVLEKLVDQEVMSAGLSEQVRDMFNDPEADYMWKEYCLQFMQPLYDRQTKDRNVDPASAGADDRELVAETLFSALDERDEDLAGTALLGLTRLAREHDDFDSEKVTAEAVEIAQDPSASDRCRLTALRVAAAANSADILPVARDLAQNAKTDLLKAAAITTLGDFADPEDKDLLTQLSTAPRRQIASAAKAALRRYDAESTSVSKP